MHGLMGCFRFFCYHFNAYFSLFFYRIRNFTSHEQHSSTRAGAPIG